jgi:hypothetical protein
MITIEIIQNFLTNKVKDKWGPKFYNHIDMCGLEPVLSTYRYHCTPKNSITFAATGGDGVHFNVLTGHNQVNVQPIVMTVPMVDLNFVLAETFEEFLGQGINNGWFALEQLAYDYDDTIVYYATEDDSKTEEEKNFLEFVRGELKIKPVSLTKDRLKELTERYRIEL